MFSVPFPVITLFALLVLIVMALFPEKNRHSGTLRFLIACTVLLTLGTLRWEYDSAHAQEYSIRLSNTSAPARMAQFYHDDRC
ncbi:Uncharacterised protein [Lelliottia amnigena]|nr:Uncharacterised protein [Lelliottia amnigena]